MPNAIMLWDDDWEEEEGDERWIHHPKTSGQQLNGGSVTLWAIVQPRDVGRTCCFISSSHGSPTIDECNYWLGMESGHLAFKLWHDGSLHTYEANAVCPGSKNQDDDAVWDGEWNLVAVSFTSGEEPELYVGLMANIGHQTDAGAASHGIGGTRLYHQQGTWSTGSTGTLAHGDNEDTIYIGRDSTGNYFSNAEEDFATGSITGYGIIDEHVFDADNPDGTEDMGGVSYEYFQMPLFIEDIDDWATNPLPAPGQYPYVWEVGGAKEDGTTDHYGEVQRVTVDDGDDVLDDLSDTLKHSLIVPGTVTITAEKASDASTMTVTDDGSGTLIGDVDGDGANTIDYTTGAVDLDFVAEVASAESADKGNATCRYTFDSNHKLFVFFEAVDEDWEYAIRNHCAAEIFDPSDSGHGVAHEGASSVGGPGAYPSGWHVATNSGHMVLSEGGGALRRKLPQEKAPADIQGHTSDHWDLTGRPRSEVIGTYRGLDSRFRENGLDAPAHTAYPNGTYNANVKEWTAECRLTGRTAQGTPGDKTLSTKGINIYPIDSTDTTTTPTDDESNWYELACFQLHGHHRGTDYTDGDLADAKEFIDQMEMGIDVGLYMTYTHGVRRFPWQNWHSDPSAFAELVDYVNGKGVRVETLAEAYRLIEQEGGGTFDESILTFTTDDQYTGVFQYGYREMARMLGCGGTHYVSDGGFDADGEWSGLHRCTYDDVCAAAGLPVSSLVVTFMEGTTEKTGLFPRAVSPNVTGNYVGFPRLWTAYGKWQRAPHQGFTEIGQGRYAMPVCNAIPRIIRVHAMNFELESDEIEVVREIPPTVAERVFVPRHWREEIEQAVRIRVKATDAVNEIRDAIFTKAGITAGGTTTFADILKAVYALAHGKFVVDGDDVTFFDDDGSTELFTFTVGEGTGRALKEEDE